ncbi:16S rRNA (uracil(1498)-N(3))-methyltransferase [Roseivirga sp. E12]|uniref:16S rRNA (uracil(1498)-N(3))-methyltransferase n=1 Tax=Roseivirga sp. E12 TaxID=2819237 RepID=UPI001ABCAD7F|nr:16S rRNA (uracil(1498)-N(3))-methyltransferase [Roseivirga sp. E12]MBO3697057.1 16S rRNA (uracil(1498)-N(3))-methyltransferase [Roseivirga sp. E12]
MQLFYQPELVNGIHHLSADESRHAIKVLRLKLGQEIQLIDGKGSFYKARITGDNHKKCEFEVIEKKEESKQKGYRHIAIAPTKNLDRTEWFVEKAVEIGVDRISFILTKNSERKVLKTDRLVKKAISAMKQSIKATLPLIDEMVTIKSFLAAADGDNKFIAYVDFDNPTELKSDVGEDNLVLIGPEGDFTQEEVDLAIAKGFQKVSLGQSRLRTETAGVAAVHILNLFP